MPNLPFTKEISLTQAVVYTLSGNTPSSGGRAKIKTEKGTHPSPLVTAWYLLRFLKECQLDQFICLLVDFR